MHAASARAYLHKNGGVLLYTSAIPEQRHWPDSWPDMMTADNNDNKKE
jgi:hypothetical protein